MWHVWKVLAIVASLMVGLAGCSGGSPFTVTATVTGTPVPQAEHVVAGSPGGYRSDAAAPSDPTKPPKPGGEPAGKEIAPGLVLSPRDAPYVDTFRVARMIDPCALHDVAAAEAAAGMGPDKLMPSGSGLHMCELSMATSARDLPAWTLMISAGVRFDETRRAGFAPEQVGGMDVFRETASPGGAAPDERTCRFVKPLGEVSGIELLVRTGSSSASPTKKPCELAAAYLAGVAKVWTEPAMRADTVTTPGLRLGDVDPCAGVVGVAGVLREAMRVQTSDPYSCMAYPLNTKSLSPGGTVTVKLSVETDPRVLVGSPAGTNYRAVTVAGRPGVVSEVDAKIGAKGQTAHICTLTVLADEKTTMQADQSRADSPTTYQVIKTTSADCAHGIKAAEAVLAALG